MESKDYKLFSFPLRTFEPENLLQEMLDAKPGTVFVLGEDRICHPEGDDTVELVWVQVQRSKDSNFLREG